MTKNLACGLLTMLIAAVYLVASTGLRESLLGDSVGSAGFPKLLGWGMALAGLALVVQNLWTRYRGRVVQDAEAWIPSEAFRKGALRATWRGAGIVAIVVAYLLLFHPAGYLVAAPLLIGATAVYLGAPVSWVTLATALFGAFALWLIFSVLLRVPLPLGPLAAWL